jgi:hypothetical protein
MPNPIRLSLVVSSSFAVCLAFVAGCSSDSHSDRPENAAIVVPDYPPAMSGAENFADGKIAVEVTLGLPNHFHPGKDGGHGGSTGGGGHHGGHRGGGRHGGGMGSEGGYPGVEGSGESAHEGGDDDAPRPVVRGSTLPPAQLKLHLQNNSATEAVSCEVEDFNSTLGNFAVFPSTYQLGAGQSATSETMTSRLGVESSEIPVTVALRIQGKVEKKVITLHQIPPVAKPADPAPAK